MLVVYPTPNTQNVKTQNIKIELPQVNLSSVESILQKYKYTSKTRTSDIRMYTMVQTRVDENETVHTSS